MKTRIFGKSIMTMLGTLKPVSFKVARKFTPEEWKQIVESAKKLHEASEKWLDETYGKDRDTKSRTPDEERLRQMD